MPTYEYKCDACGGNFEELQSFAAAPVEICPLCGKKKARRLLGAGAGLIFRGSGFYITDYKNKNAGENAAKSAESPSKP